MMSRILDASNRHVSVGKLRYCRNQVLGEKREEATKSPDGGSPNFEATW